MAVLFLPHRSDQKCMVFIDGENLIIGFTAEAKSGNKPIPKHVVTVENVFVWSRALWTIIQRHGGIRTYYYASVQGDTNRLDAVEERMKSAGIECPRVFKKPRGMPSKRVDVTLTTEMLTHAARGNMSLAVLVSGDEDFVPLIEAVKAYGCLVYVWSVNDGLSHKLKVAADHFCDLSPFLFSQTFTGHE
jgi:hypothetical protein